MSVKTLALGILHDQVDVLRGVYCLIVLYDVWKVEATQNSNLSYRLLLALSLLEL